jgi:CDP-diacylglycerol---glycerol-3-phosphate 3-phosphatidyltransferase
MPSIYGLKPAFQNLLRPLVRGLANAGVTANQVTLTAMALSFAVVVPAQAIAEIAASG